MGHRVVAVVWIIAIALISEFRMIARRKIRAYFNLACNRAFVLSSIHIRQIGEVCTIVSADLKQNHTKLPNRIRMLDRLDYSHLLCLR